VSLPGIVKRLVSSLLKPLIAMNEMTKAMAQMATTAQR
jgi:hypothetical protein